MSRYISDSHIPGTFIEMTRMKMGNDYLDEGSGFIRVDGLGAICFEIFRNPNKKSCFRMIVRNPARSVLVETFEDKFYYMDFENRRIIKWIGENGQDLVLFKVKK